uniref:C2H2-type domain-containing protein n=1 Tax=Panagrellus redivivus TaxID=6233 RepID=A0A7E4VUK2_PANRE
MIEKRTIEIGGKKILERPRRTRSLWSRHERPRSAENAFREAVAWCVLVSRSSSLPLAVFRDRPVLLACFSFPSTCRAAMDAVYRPKPKAKIAGPRPARTATSNAAEHNQRSSQEGMRTGARPFSEIECITLDDDDEGPQPVPVSSPEAANSSSGSEPAAHVPETSAPPKPEIITLDSDTEPEEGQKGDDLFEKIFGKRTPPPLVKKETSTPRRSRSTAVLTLSSSSSSNGSPAAAKSNLSSPSKPSSSVDGNEPAPKRRKIGSSLDTSLPCSSTSIIGKGEPLPVPVHCVQTLEPVEVASSPEPVETESVPQYEAPNPAVSWLLDILPAEKLQTVEKEQPVSSTPADESVTSSTDSPQTDTMEYDSLSSDSSQFLSSLVERQPTEEVESSIADMPPPESMEHVKADVASPVSSVEAPSNEASSDELVDVKPVVNQSEVDTFEVKVSLMLKDLVVESPEKSAPAIEDTPATSFDSSLSRDESAVEAIRRFNPNRQTSPHDDVIYTEVKASMDSILQHFSPNRDDAATDEPPGDYADNVINLDDSGDSQGVAERPPSSAKHHPSPIDVSSDEEGELSDASSIDLYESESQTDSFRPIPAYPVFDTREPGVYVDTRQLGIYGIYPPPVDVIREASPEVPDDLVLTQKYESLLKHYNVTTASALFKLPSFKLPPFEDFKPHIKESFILFRRDNIPIYDRLLRMLDPNRQTPYFYIIFTSGGNINDKVTKRVPGAPMKCAQCGKVLTMGHLFSRQHFKSYYLAGGKGAPPYTIEAIKADRRY